ncbi:MAG: endonuclease V [Palaeococcus sp.]|uniref:endonuclease V n=1 Tax=Palaeococcus sp. (in: euryarchaeotes) TaxID=2820298 RepID=UPI0025F341AA|nr:endonuclease V [Palaeococcus sp. (in: euryarchaeotes)]MCD6558872.1 endonuclease V [Palaeococcus sp. (in: euryarchaeotes)]
MNLKKLEKIQKELSTRIVEKPLNLDEVSTIAAVDVAYKGDLACYSFVLCSFPSCEILKIKRGCLTVKMDYIPTFFFLRETRPVLVALGGENFDVLIVEGHGRAHPRGYGLASHIGLLVRKPTIGVAKRPLIREGMAKVGRAYVSVGNLIDLNSAVRIIERINERGYPKPLRIADKESKRALAEAL